MPWQALATLGGGIIGAFGQHATNRQNMRIAQMNNQYNRMMMQEQNKWNLDQWHRQNAYNDPSEQRKRLEKAGINPAIALGSISPGQAESLTSAGAHPAETPQLSNAMQPLADGVTNAMNQYLQSKSVEAQIRKINAEAEAVEIGNITEGERRQEELTGMRKNNKLTDSKINETDLRAMETGTLLPHRERQILAQIENANADTNLKEVEKDLKLDELKELRPQQREAIKAQIFRDYQVGIYFIKQGMVSEAQIPLIAAQIANLGAHTEHTEAITKTENYLRKGLENKLHYEWMNLKKSGKLLDKDIEYYGSKELRNWMNSFSNLIGNAGYAYGSFRTHGLSNALVPRGPQIMTPDTYSGPGPKFSTGPGSEFRNINPYVSPYGR